MKQKAEASVWLVEKAKALEDNEKELLTTVKVRETQIKVSEEGKAWAESWAKEIDQHLAQAEVEIPCHQSDLREARA